MIQLLGNLVETYTSVLLRYRLVLEGICGGRKLRHGLHYYICM